VIDLVHLLAELIENALGFSPPDTTVEIDGRSLGQGGYQLAVIDHGVGMSDVELVAANHRLAGLDEVDGMPTRYLGQYVIAKLGSKTGALVRLQPTVGGRGVTAVVTLPAQATVGGADRSSIARPLPGSRAARDQGPAPFAPGAGIAGAAGAGPPTVEQPETVIDPDADPFAEPVPATAELADGPDADWSWTPELPTYEVEEPGGVPEVVYDDEPIAFEAITTDESADEVPAWAESSGIAAIEAAALEGEETGLAGSTFDGPAIESTAFDDTAFEGTAFEGTAFEGTGVEPGAGVDEVDAVPSHDPVPSFDPAPAGLSWDAADVPAPAEPLPIDAAAAGQIAAAAWQGPAADDAWNVDAESGAGPDLDAAPGAPSWAAAPTAAVVPPPPPPPPAAVPMQDWAPAASEGGWSPTPSATTSDAAAPAPPAWAPAEPPATPAPMGSSGSSELSGTAPSGSGSGSGGLAKRVPGASLSESPLGNHDAPPPAAADRSADGVRSMLSAFQSGRSRGRGGPLAVQDAEPGTSSDARGAMEHTGAEVAPELEDPRDH
jgi:hypothetical protein